MVVRRTIMSTIVTIPPTINLLILHRIRLLGRARIRGKDRITIRLTGLKVLLPDNNVNQFNGPYLTRRARIEVFLIGPFRPTNRDLYINVEVNVRTSTISSCYLGPPSTILSGVNRSIQVLLVRIKRYNGGPSMSDLLRIGLANMEIRREDRFVKDLLRLIISFRLFYLLLPNGTFQGVRPVL